MQEFKHLWMEVCSWITSVSFHHLNRKQFCDFSSAMGAALDTALGNWILKWLCSSQAPECNVWCLPNFISHLACHIYMSHWPLTSFQFDNLSCSSQIIPLGPYAECRSDNYSAGSSWFWQSYGSHNVQCMFSASNLHWITCSFLPRHVLVTDPLTSLTRFGRDKPVSATQPVWC